MRNILEKTVNFQEKHEKFVRKSSFIRFSLSNLKTKSELRFRVFCHPFNRNTSSTAKLENNLISYFVLWIKKKNLYTV